MEGFSRTKLYKLEITGLGTFKSQSLTAYLSQLAHEHSVTVSDLVYSEIVPLLDNKYIKRDGEGNMFLNHGLFHNSHLINGAGNIAESFTNALDTLTGNSQLKYLTLLPFRDILGNNRLLRKTKAWCPDCFRDMVENGNKLTEPLLWSFETVTVCPQHHRLLERLCTVCSHPIKILEAGRVVFGFCSCGANLSSPVNKFSEDIGSFEIWKAENIGLLLSQMTCGFSEHFNKIKLAEILTLGGNYIKKNLDDKDLMARIYSSRRNLVYKGIRPSLDLLLQISFKTSTRLCEWFTRPSQELAIYDEAALNKKPRVQNVVTKKVIKKRHDPAITISKLKGYIKSDPPHSIRRVARELGLDRKTILKHYPSPYQEIVLRHRSYRAFKKSEAAARLYEKVKNAVEELVATGEYPHSYKVERKLGLKAFKHSNYRLAYKEVMQAINQDGKHSRSVTYIDPLQNEHEE